LKASYESMRRLTIDRFALHLALLAVQSEVDKVSDAIDTLINGDGNSNTSATSYNLTTLDTGATAGTPTVQGYLSWRMQWSSPYLCNVVLAREAHVVELFTMNIGSANVTFSQMIGAFGIGGATPIAPQLAPVVVGWTNDVAAEKWLGTDTRFALEMVTEVGATLTETNRIVSEQFDEIVLTEVMAFCVMDQNATKVLALDA
jgi:hypothetical protein